jgi:hypothetical protein
LPGLSRFLLRRLYKSAYASRRSFGAPQHERIRFPAQPSEEVQSTVSKGEAGLRQTDTLHRVPHTAQLSPRWASADQREATPSTIAPLNTFMCASACCCESVLLNTGCSDSFFYKEHAKAESWQNYARRTTRVVLRAYGIARVPVQRIHEHVATATVLGMLRPKKRARVWHVKCHDLHERQINDVQWKNG